MRLCGLSATTLLSAAIAIGPVSCKRTAAGQQSARVTRNPTSPGASAPPASASAPALTPAELTASDRALGKAASIPDEVLLSAKGQGKNLRRLEGRNEEDEMVPAAGVTIDVDRHHALRVVRSLRSSLGQNYFVFISEQNFGIGGQLDNVSILKTSDPYAAMRVMGTNADNYEMTRTALIAQLKNGTRRTAYASAGSASTGSRPNSRASPPTCCRLRSRSTSFAPTSSIKEQGP